MSNDAGEAIPEGPRHRFPIGTLLKALFPALAATALVVYLFGHSTPAAKRARADGTVRVTLSEKDSAFVPVPPSAGGATAEVLYRPRGPRLHFILHAAGLSPGHRYVLEMQADDAIYSVGSYAPDERGGLAIDTTMAQFAEGVCVGTNFDMPRSVRGHHSIKFRIKRDGSPASGTMPGIEAKAPGGRLACHGNGDGNFGYVLLEDEDVDFTGTDASVQDTSK